MINLFVSYLWKRKALRLIVFNYKVVNMIKTICKLYEKENTDIYNNCYSTLTLRSSHRRRSAKRFS